MKKRGLIIGLALLAILFSACGEQIDESELAQNRRVSFLNHHIYELTDYIKKQDSKIVNVTYDWNSVDSGIIGNGLPQGAGNIISIDTEIFDANNKKINLVSLGIIPDDINHPRNIVDMYMLSGDFEYMDSSSVEEQINKQSEKLIN